MDEQRIPILLLFTASLIHPDLPFYRISYTEVKMTATKAPSARELGLLELHSKCTYNGRFGRFRIFPSRTHVNGHTI
jgi:hypothetical protein